MEGLSYRRNKLYMLLLYMLSVSPHVFIRQDCNINSEFNGKLTVKPNKSIRKTKFKNKQTKMQLHKKSVYNGLLLSSVSDRFVACWTLPSTSFDTFFLVYFILKFANACQCKKLKRQHLCSIPFGHALSLPFDRSVICQTLSIAKLRHFFLFYFRS